MSGMEALRKILGGANSKLDDLLVKSPMMRKKAPGVSFDKATNTVSGGQPGLVPNQVDGRKKAALLGGIGGLGVGTGMEAYDMMGDDEGMDDNSGDQLEQLKKMLGI